MPRSPNQAAYLRALEQHDLVFALGPAGTGKTYLAVAAAVSFMRERRIERGDRDAHPRQTAAPHLAQDIDIARHQRSLGDDPDRMSKRLQHLQHLAHDPPLPLDRLIGIGVRPDGDGGGRIALGRKLPP